MFETTHLRTLFAWLGRHGRVHALAALGALLVVGVPLEVAFRAFDYFGLNEPQQVFALRRRGLRAGRPWSPREFVVRTGMNSDGVRGPELGASEGEERRVVVAGDSFVEALQVEYEDSFVALAEKRDPTVRLVPYRVGNHPFDERHALWLETYDRLFDGGDGRPRANAVVYAVRDHSLRFADDSRMPIQWFLFRDTRLRRFLERYSLAPSAVLGFTCYRIREWAEPHGGGLEQGERAFRAQVETYVDRVLDGIEADCGRLGLDVGILYIPTWPEVSDRRRGARATWRPAEALRAAAEARGIPFEDGTPDVVEHGGPQPYFEHDRHPTEAGHAALARTLEHLLDAMGYGPPR